MRSASMLCLIWGSIAAAAAAPAADAPSGTAPAAAHAAAAPVSAAPMAATWQEQHLTFSYLGRTVRYSCEGLREKVRAMLLDLGARRDVRLTASGCVDTSRFPAHSAGPSLSIVFSGLVPAAADPRADDAPAIGARFETFVLTSDAFRNMGIGDCELVEDFARQVLPKLATRHVKQDIRCVPYQESGNRFLIQGEVLKAFTPPAQPRVP